MKNKIILIYINSKTRCYGLTENEYSAIQPNIMMALLDSYLTSKGIEVEMIDETFDFSILDYIKYIHKEKPILFGVVCCGANPSSSTMSMVGAINFFKEYNKNKCKNVKSFIVGGHPSVTPERTMLETNVDYVIIGEGYEIIERLYYDILNKKDIKFTGAYHKLNRDSKFPPHINLNLLPMVNWKKINPNKYRAHNWHTFDNIKCRSPYGVIWTSFGCPWLCYFCCVNNIFGKRAYRMRNIESVLREIDILVSLGVKNIKIMDELFIIKNERINKFCEGLEKRKYDLNMWSYGRVDTVTPQILKRLKNVGMNWISYGFENVSQKILDNIQKGYKANYDEVIKWTKDAGMNICADFMAGSWEDDYNTLNDTYEFACKHNFEWLNIYPVFAYPGTPMYDDYIRTGKKDIVKNWEEYALYGYNCKPCKTKYLTAEQVLEWRDEIFLKYHSRPEYLKIIRDKFGEDTMWHIFNMTKKKLKRKILGD